MINRASVAPNIKKKSQALLRQRLSTVITSASSFIQVQRPPRPNKRKNRRIYSSLVSLASPILLFSAFGTHKLMQNLGYWKIENYNPQSLTHLCPECTLSYTSNSQELKQLHELFIQNLNLDTTSWELRKNIKEAYHQ